MFLYRREANPDRTPCDSCDNRPRFLNFITTPRLERDSPSDCGLAICSICLRNLLSQLKGWVKTHTGYKK